jgi:hypothetical protein
MRKRKNSILLIFIFTVLFSCKKDDIDRNVIYPGPYFPVYPNSYWKYVQKDGDTITKSTSSDYLPDSFISEEYNVYTEDAYVPFWNGIPIYGYCTPVFVNANDKGRVLTPLLRDKAGFEWITWQSINDSIIEFVSAMDTVLTVKGTLYQNVIVVEKNSWSDHQLSNIYSYRFYARDIGLIKEIDLNISNNDTLRFSDLIEYHIGEK